MLVVLKMLLLFCAILSLALPAVLCEPLPPFSEKCEKMVLDYPVFHDGYAKGEQRPAIVERLKGFKAKFQTFVDGLFQAGEANDPCKNQACEYFIGLFFHRLDPKRETDFGSMNSLNFDAMIEAATQNRYCDILCGKGGKPPLLGRLAIQQFHLTNLSPVECPVGSR